MMMMILMNAANKIGDPFKGRNVGLSQFP